LFYCFLLLKTDLYCFGTVNFRCHQSCGFPWVVARQYDWLNMRLICHRYEEMPPKLSACLRCYNLKCVTVWLVGSKHSHTASRVKLFWVSHVTKSEISIVLAWFWSDSRWFDVNLICIYSELKACNYGGTQTDFSLTLTWFSRFSLGTVNSFVDTTDFIRWFNRGNFMASSCMQFLVVMKKLSIQSIVWIVVVEVSWRTLTDESLRWVLVFWALGFFVFFWLVGFLTV